MSQITREYPMMTPDSLRAKLRIDQKLFGSYTPRTFTRQHTNGTKYVGTLENWGDEMLLESHKLKMQYPPFQQLVCSDTIMKHFDLHYDTEVNSFAEPNAIMACLKKDTLLNDASRDYVIQYTNCQRVNVLRSLSSSDPEPTLQVVFKTTTPPELYFGASPVGDLSIIDPNYDYIPTTYFFNTTATNIELNFSRQIHSIDDLTEIQIDELKRCFIDPRSFRYISGVVSFVTLPLKQWMEQLPFMWCSVPMFNLIEDGDVNNNIDRFDNPLLTFGTDGHDNVGWFPFVTGFNNLPTFPQEYEHLSDKWLVKAFAKYDDFVTIEDDFGPDPHTLHWDMKELRKLQFCLYTDDDSPFSSIVYSQTITWNTDEIHIFINIDNIPVTVNHKKVKWLYHPPQPTDTGYDSITYNNPSYLFPTIVDLSPEHPTDELNVNYANMAGIYRKGDGTYKKYFYPMFYVKTERQYNPLSRLSPRAQVGIHVDYSSDYSEHNVDKKNGTIYNLGDYDGLPNYYKLRQARYVKRARTTLYTLRDWIGSPSQKAMKRQTAAILVDSGLPHNVNLQTSTDDMVSHIVYAYDPQKTYHTIKPDEIISPHNVLSDVVYCGGNQFGDIHNSGENKYGVKMIYHGNRKFSTTIVGELDDFEYGRVFILSNDPSNYDNNEKTSYVKPGRTFARICDIPTDYRQLIGIPGLVSTVVTDKYYVHTDCCYSDANVDTVANEIILPLHEDPSDPEAFLPYDTYGNDLQRVWNQTNHECNYTFISKHVYTNADDLNNSETDISYAGLTSDPTHCKYSKWINRNARISMIYGFNTTSSGGEYQWTITDGGSGYNVNDIIRDYVGGKFFTGIVTSVDGNGAVTSIVPESSDIVYTNVANFDGRITTYNPINSQGNGEGLTLQLEILEIIWNNMQPRVNGLIDHLFTFKMNEYEQLTVWELNENHTWIQKLVITGENFVETVYNDTLDLRYNSSSASIMYKMLMSPLTISGYDDASMSDSLNYSKAIPSKSYPDNVDDPNVYGYDFSTDIVSRGFDQEDCLFIVNPYDGIDNILDVYRFAPILSDYSKCQFPKSNQSALYQYTPRVVSLLFSGFNNGTSQMGYVPKQPNVYIYNPTRDIHVKYEQYSSDVVHLLTATPITFKYYPDMVTEGGMLTKNVYTYNVYKPSKYLQNTRDDYDAKPRQVLLNEAKTKVSPLNPDSNNPIAYAEDAANKGVPYSKSMIVDYLMEFVQYDENQMLGKQYRPLMKSMKYSEEDREYHVVDESDAIVKLRSSGETAYTDYNGKITPQGDQPLGDLVSVSTKKFDGRCKVGTSVINAELLYVMKLPDTVEISSFYNYHVRDQYSHQDISTKTLLIYKNKMYTYKDDLNTWLPVRRNI